MHTLNCSHSWTTKKNKNTLLQVDWSINDARCFYPFVVTFPGIFEFLMYPSPGNYLLSVPSVTASTVSSWRD